nr:hypothetical protein [Lachnospiraceae bacterium]
THEERLKKQRNKRSELHRKLVNKEAINNSEENVMNSRMDMLTKVIDSSQVIPEAQELSDLACFMTGIEAEDQRLAEEFLGKNEKYGPDKYEGRDVSKAMDRMVIQLLDVDVSKLRLDNDEEIAKNSEKLELVSRRMAAFDRLNKEYGYLNSIGDMGALVTERLNALRYIANYYELKKDVMNDKVYYEHYNRELSMDYTKDGLTAGQKNLAQKLSELYKLGKLMMEHNGVRTDIIAKRGEPEYSDVTKVVSHYTSFGNKYNNEESAAKTLSDRQKDYTKDSYFNECLDKIRGKKESAKRRERDTRFSDDFILIETNRETAKADELKEKYKTTEFKGLSGVKEKERIFWEYSKHRENGLVEYSHKISNPVYKEYVRDLIGLSMLMERKKEGYEIENAEKYEIKSTQEQIDEYVSDLENNVFFKENKGDKTLLPVYLRDNFIDSAEEMLKDLIEEKNRNLQKFTIDLTENKIKTEKNENLKSKLNGIEASITLEEGKISFEEQDAETGWYYDYSENGTDYSEDVKKSVAAKGFFDYMGVSELMSPMEKTEIKDEKGKIHYGIKYRKNQRADQINPILENLGKHDRFVFEPNALRQMSIIALLNGVAGITDMDLENHMYFKCAEYGNACVVTSVTTGRSHYAFEKIGKESIKYGNDYLPSFKTIDLPAMDAQTVDKIIKLKPEDIDVFAPGLLDQETKTYFKARLGVIKELLIKERELDKKRPYYEKKIWSKEDWDKQENRNLLQERLKNKYRLLYPEIVLKGTSIIGANNVEEDDYANEAYVTMKKEFMKLKTPEEQLDFFEKCSYRTYAYADADALKETIFSSVYTRIRNEFMTKDIMKAHIKKYYRTMKAFKEKVEDTKRKLEGKDIPEDIFNRKKYEEELDTKLLNEVVKETDKRKEQIKAEADKQGIKLDQKEINKRSELSDAEKQEIKDRSREKIVNKLLNGKYRNAWIWYETFKENPGLFREYTSDYMFYKAMASPLDSTNLTQNRELDSFSVVYEDCQAELHYQDKEFKLKDFVDMHNELNDVSVTISDGRGAYEYIKFEKNRELINESKNIRKEESNRFMSGMFSEDFMQKELQIDKEKAKH